VQSDEGRQLRSRLAENSQQLRSSLTRAGFDIAGQVSAIVPVLLGGQDISRLATRFALSLGGLVNLVEYPAVARNSSRWRLQVMAEHRASDIAEFVRIASEARKRAVDFVQDSTEMVVT
jgi:glycine C-acetyltransferase